MPFGNVSTNPICFSSVDLANPKIFRPDELRKPRRVDPLAQPQAHHQQLVALFFPRQHVVGVDAVAAGLDALLPVERQFFGCRRMPVIVDQQPPVRAGPDADVFAVAPVEEVAPRLLPGPRVVGRSRRPEVPLPL